MAARPPPPTPDEYANRSPQPPPVRHVASPSPPDVPRVAVPTPPPGPRVPGPSPPDAPRVAAPPPGSRVPGPSPPDAPRVAAPPPGSRVPGPSPPDAPRVAGPTPPPGPRVPGPSPPDAPRVIAGPTPPPPSHADAPAARPPPPRPGDPVVMAIAVRPSSPPIPDEHLPQAADVSHTPTTNDAPGVKKPWFDFRLTKTKSLFSSRDAVILDQQQVDDHIEDAILEEGLPLSGTGFYSPQNDSLISRAIDHGIIKPNKLHKKKHAVNRAVICFFAILLLWLTSLQLCEALVAVFVYAPCSNSITNSIDISNSAIISGKNSYEGCAYQIQQDCNYSVVSAQQAESALVASQQQSNTELLQYLYTVRDWCSIEVTDGLTTLQYLQNNLSVNVQAMFGVTAQANNPRCQLVTNMLQGGVGAIQALSTTQDFSVSANDQTESTLDAIDARLAYDEWYFAEQRVRLEIIANTTLPGLLNDTLLSSYFQELNSSYNLYLACISPTQNYQGQTCSTQSLLAAAASIQLVAQQQFNNSIALVQSWEAKVMNTINTANNFYLQLKGNSLLQQAINLAFNLQGLPSLSDMGFDSVGTISNTPFSSDPMSGFDYEAIMASYESQVTGYAQAITQQQSSALQQQSNLRAAQLGLTQKYPLSPYSPPAVNATAEKATVANQTSSLVSTVSGQLTNTVIQGEETTGTFASSGALPTANTSATILANIPARTIDFYVPNLGISFPSVAAAIAFLSSCSIGLDYAYRVVRTIQIIHKYWRISEIAMPPADVRSDDLQNTDLIIGGKDPLQRVVLILVSPRSLCVIMTGMGFAVLVALTTLYAPFYYEFVNECVLPAGIDQSNGTMLSVNVYRIATSYMTSAGNNTLTVGLDHINAERQVNCKADYDASNTVQTNDQNEWDYIADDHNYLQYQAETLSICLDIPAIQSNYSTAAAKATKNNITNLNDALPGPSCSYNFPPLFNAIYNCTDIVCLGESLCTDPVVEENVEFLTWQASCLAEAYVHASIMGPIMIVLVYVLCNCGRTFIVNGFNRAIWRHLTDGRFSYLASCNKNGETIFPSRVNDGEVTMKEAIKEHLAIGIERWEKNASLMFFSGFYINLIWIIALIVLNQSLGLETGAAYAKLQRNEC